MTIGELKNLLNDCDENDEIIFGCHALKFNGLKNRGERLVQLEFKQGIWKNTETGRWHVYDYSTRGMA